VVDIPVWSEESDESLESLDSGVESGVVVVESPAPAAVVVVESSAPAAVVVVDSAGMVSCATEVSSVWPCTLPAKANRPIETAIRYLTATFIVYVVDEQC
jgi:hypothetical protein